MPGMKRHLIWTMDFDSRAHTLELEIGDHWDPQVKEQWRQNKDQIAGSVAGEFGSEDLERKLRDFAAIGVRPFSIISHHNTLFAQVRDAFVQGAYYPALTGACALGERILNHLVIDLRDEFRSTPEYKSV